MLGSRNKHNFAAFPVVFLALLAVSLSTSLFGQTKANDNLALGKPSGARIDLKQPDNYLVIHNGFTLSYNKSRGAANWVAWHLEKADIGTAERTNAFAPDTTLPREWWITPADYTGSGYDRGHLCPSKDRSTSAEANRVTFLMSNMQPQAPKLNQKTWKYLEDYTREIVKNNEAYVYSGCYGSAGTIKNKITIPTNCWKIIIVLPEGNNDAKRIDKNTRIITVNMPNTDEVSARWRTYLTTVDDIESATGYDFLANVPKRIQAVIEAVKDRASLTGGGSEENSEGSKTSPGGNSPLSKKPRNSAERTYITGPRGGCYYINDSGKKTYVDKGKCQ